MFIVLKPPATIVIKLSCNIELHSIRIWTCIGSLKSTKIEIYSRNSNEQFTKICAQTALEEPGINFSQYQTVDSSDILKPSQFFRSASYMIKNVNEFQVCIKETQKSPPVIKKIEIWGKCSKSNTQEDNKSIMELWDRQINPSQKFSVRTNPKQQLVEFNEQVDSELLIDDDFLDCITYEIMSIPMILPSGKIVDQNTILKHNLYEEKLGRSPSDPFTFQIYTNTRKPILNAALKGRIDAFLLKNSENPELKGVGRTVGIRKFTENTACSSKQYYGIESSRKRLKLETSATSTITEPSTLDSMISNALKNITRFSQLKKIEHINICFSCECSKIESLYKIIKCSHHICRKCILDNKLFCIPCSKFFNKTDVEKFHI